MSKSGYIVESLYVLEKDTDNFCFELSNRLFPVFIPKSSWNKTLSSQLYDIYSTDIKKLLKSAEPLIIKRLKKIHESLSDLEKRKSQLLNMEKALDKLLVGEIYL